MHFGYAFVAGNYPNLSNQKWSLQKTDTKTLLCDENEIR